MYINTHPHYIKCLISQFLGGLIEDLNIGLITDNTLLFDFKL